MRYDDFLFIDSTNKKVELLNHVIAILHFFKFYFIESAECSEQA
jgi:hypothetical protein